MGIEESQAALDKEARDLIRSIFAAFFVIFFLTGCARRGYYTPVEGPKPSPAFTWPANGQVILPFGAWEDGVPIKGVVLESTDSSVRAAYEGRVVFIDEALPGYGGTLILKHDQDFSTVYARNDVIQVRLGQRVKQGEPIARAKETGSAARIYFELRKSTRPVDPVEFCTKAA